VISQREADLGVLIAIYTRSDDRESARQVHRVRNRLTAGGYMTVQQFEAAIDKLQRLRMIELEDKGDARFVEASSHGATWLMTNFHWVRGDTATLAPNREDWTMTAPKRRSLLGTIFGTNR